MTTRHFILSLTLTALWASPGPAQDACKHKRHFSGEEDPCLDKAPAPAPAVIAAILKTKEASQSYEAMEPTERTDVAKLFQGLTVHLRNRQQDDMTVRGSYHMSGGDNTWFWVVTSSHNRPVALWVGTNAVTILRSRHHACADIKTDWAAGSHPATNVYRYDGHRYKLFKEDYRNLPPS